MQHHRSHRTVQLSVREGEGVQLALSEFDCGAIRRDVAQAAASLLEHPLRAVDADQSFADAGERPGDVARAAAEIGEGQAGTEEVGGRPLTRRPALEQGSNLVPVAGNPVEERPLVPLALGEDSREAQPVGLVLSDPPEVRLERVPEPSQGGGSPALTAADRRYVLVPARRSSSRSCSRRTRRWLLTLLWAIPRHRASSPTESSSMASSAMARMRVESASTFIKVGAEWGWVRETTMA